MFFFEQRDRIADLLTFAFRIIGFGSFSLYFLTEEGFLGDSFVKVHMDRTLGNRVYFIESEQIKRLILSDLI